MGKTSDWTRRRVLPAAVLASVLAVSPHFLSGCIFRDVGNFFVPELPPWSTDVVESYYGFALGGSTSAEVLSAYQEWIDEYEKPGTSHLLSHTSDAVALSGRKKGKYKKYFTMIAFDENSLTASRKYLFIVDERPKRLFVEPWETVHFECKMKLKDPGGSYTTANERNIAVLKSARETLRDDAAQIGAEDDVVNIGGMMANQILEAVIVKLEAATGHASKLHEPSGLAFEHRSLGRGRLRMVVGNGVITIKTIAGSAARKSGEGFATDIYGDGLI
jgi:hypothetical protein